MNKNLKNFLQGYLNVEVAHDDMNEVVATSRKHSIQEKYSTSNAVAREIEVSKLPGD